MGIQPWRGRDVVWVYPPLEAATAEAVMQEADTYVSLRHNKFEQVIATRPIMDLCLAVKRRPGSRVTKR